MNTTPIPAFEPYKHLALLDHARELAKTRAWESVTGGAAVIYAVKAAQGKADLVRRAAFQKFDEAYGPNLRFERPGMFVAFEAEFLDHVIRRAILHLQGRLRESAADRSERTGLPLDAMQECARRERAKLRALVAAFPDLAQEGI